MKIALVTKNSIPVLAGSGESVFLSALVDQLELQGHQVFLISYDLDYSLWMNRLDCSDEAELCKKVNDRNIVPYFSNLRSSDKHSRFEFVTHAIWPKPEHYYSGYRYTEWVSKILDQISPDIVFTYMVDAITCVANDRKPKKYLLVSLITDLDHIVRKYRGIYLRKKGGEIFALRDLLASRNQPKLEVALLKQCDLVCSSAYHHHKWLKNKGVTHIQYIPVPVQDHHIESATIFSQQIRESKKKTISLIGNVNGLATLSGLWYLKNTILPEMLKLTNLESFEFRIIGDGTLDPELEQEFSKYSWIKRIGFLENIQDVFLQSDIILVPTPIPSGFRTRIAEAFSYGCCVIAHKSNALGMPELENEKNVLLAENGTEFVQKIVKCLNEPNTRRMIGWEARKTFAKFYDSKVVISQILNYCINFKNQED